MNKALLIWHAAVIDEYRERVRAIADHNDIDYTLIVPRKWNEHNRKGNRFTKSEKDKNINIRVAHTFFKNAIIFIFLNKLFSEIFKKPDIIHLHEEPYSLVALQTILLKNIISPRSKIIVESARGVHKKVPFPFNLIQNFVLKNTAVLFARSAHVQQLYQKNFAFKKPIKIIPNGISYVKNDYISRQQTHTIGFIGKISQHKGADLLLDAFHKLPEKFNLLLIGKNTLAVKETSRIKIISNVPNTEIRSWVNKMDIMVLPSRTTKTWIDTFPRVLVEAMACGTPIIGSTSGEIPKILGREDVLFHEGDINELYDRINTLLSDKQKLLDISKYNIKRVTEKFTWQKIARTIIDHYNEVIKNT